MSTSPSTVATAVASHRPERLSVLDNEAMQDYLNSIHIPEDAGEHADDLRRILARIPDGWGRWISCASGWFPMVIELDRKLAELIPDYELHQVKEKFGTLRYYAHIKNPKPQCCIDLEASRPHDGAVDPDWLRGQERTLKEQYELDKWYYEQFLTHSDTEEHKAQDEALNPERKRLSELGKWFFEIINEYEDLSGTICESCGATAHMRARGYWYRTLCDSCAKDQGYDEIPEEEES